MIKLKENYERFFGKNSLSEISDSTNLWDPNGPEDRQVIMKALKKDRKIMKILGPKPYWDDIDLVSPDHDDETIVSLRKNMKFRDLKKSILKFGKNIDKLREKISKEEWAQYPKYARKLKPYMQRLFKVPLRVKVIKQANANPWIDISVVRFGKDIIPNDFRKKALKVIGGGRARDMDNINYGNIRSNSISLLHSQWVELLPGKIKESIIELREMIREEIQKLNERIERNEVHAETKKELKTAIARSMKEILSGKTPKYDIINGRSGEMIGWRDGNDYIWQPNAIPDAERELK